MSGYVNTVEIMGDDALVDAIIQRNLSGVFNDEFITNVGADAFRGCALTSVNLPAVVSCGENAFSWCRNMVTADFAVVESLAGNVFGWCYALKKLIIRTTACVCSLGQQIQHGPIPGGTGHIYVPRALVDSYKAATNWSVHAAQFRALEDYTVDGTVTGEIDETKI